MSNDKFTFAKDLLQQAKEVLEEMLTDAEGELDELEEQDNSDNSEDAEKIEETKSLIDKLEGSASDIGDIINQLP